MRGFALWQGAWAACCKAPKAPTLSALLASSRAATSSTCVRRTTLPFSLSTSTALRPGSLQSQSTGVKRATPESGPTECCVNVTMPSPWIDFGWQQKWEGLRSGHSFGEVPGVSWRGFALDCTLLKVPVRRRAAACDDSPRESRFPTCSCTCLLLPEFSRGPFLSVSVFLQSPFSKFVLTVSAPCPRLDPCVLLR